MLVGKTSPALWFSSMITRILVTVPGTAAWAAVGEAAGELAGVAWEELAGGWLACPLQPAASQPASPAPISRAATVRPGWLLTEDISAPPSPPERDMHSDLICVDLAIQCQQPSHMQIGS
jgi:hypothetical protein